MQKEEKLNVTKEEKFKDSIQLHIQRVLDYNLPVEVKEEIKEEVKDEDVVVVTKIKNVPKKRTNKNSEVD